MGLPTPFFERDEQAIRGELAGFPRKAIEAVLLFQAERSPATLAEAMRAILAFYLPKGKDRELTGLPDSTQLREELGVDSLTLAEAAFKLDELFGIPIGTREVSHLATLGELQGFLEGKLGIQAVV